jgi:hypothetical protein
VLICDAPNELSADTLAEAFRFERPAYVMPAQAGRTANAPVPRLLWNPPQGAFPPATIAERQRWGEYLFEQKNRNVEAFWTRLSAAYRGSIPLPLALPGAEPDSVQLAWDTEKHHLDVTILADGPEEWFFMDRQTGELRDGVLPEDEAAFRELLIIVAG